MKGEVVAVVGAGLIGRSWAITFARGGYTVRLFDVSESALKAAEQGLSSTVYQLVSSGVLNGVPPREILDRIVMVDRLDHALLDAVHVQENAPESLDAKVALFRQLDALTPSACTLASSTSALLPSSFSSHLTHRERVLVAHPLNPPHLVRAVELVPAPWTTEGAITAVANIMTVCGQVPIRLKREIPGFIMNRLQGALLHEAFRLVDEGYATVADVDAAVHDGLGMRWAFMGPFETIDLNAPGGVADFIDRYGEAYAEIGKGQCHTVSWRGSAGDEVTRQRRDALAAGDIHARQMWRDRELARIAALKRGALTPLAVSSDGWGG